MPFGITPFTRASVAALKNAIRDLHPEIKSSHVDEAIAFSFGFDTYAAMLPVLDLAESTSCISVQIQADWFALRLSQLGYDPHHYRELRQKLWGGAHRTTPAAEKRMEAARDLFKPRPANDV